MISKQSTLEMTREEWLVERRKSIGGSEAAAICGLNPYASAYSVWADKLGIIPEQEDNEAMRQGRDLEEYVARRWCEETGKKVRRDNSIIRNDEYPFAHANVDRVVVGEDAGLECKTTNDRHLAELQRGEYPSQYYVQCMHYMMVTGKSRWYLAVLVLGKGFFHFVVERNQAEIDSLAAAEREFWQMVVDRKEPAPDGAKPTTAAIDAVHSEASEDDDEVDLFAYETDLQLISEAKKQIAELEETIDRHQNAIKVALGGHTRGRVGAFSVSWKEQVRRSFDAKAFSAANVGVDITPFYKESRSRVFRMNEQQN